MPIDMHEKVNKQTKLDEDNLSRGLMALFCHDIHLCRLLSLSFSLVGLPKAKSQASNLACFCLKLSKAFENRKL